MSSQKDTAEVSTGSSTMKDQANINRRSSEGKKITAPKAQYQPMQQQNKQQGQKSSIPGSGMAKNYAKEKMTAIVTASLGGGGLLAWIIS